MLQREEGVVLEGPHSPSHQPLVGSGDPGVVCEDTSGVAAKMATSIWVLCVGPPFLHFPCLSWLVSGHQEEQPPLLATVT